MSTKRAMMCGAIILGLVVIVIAAFLIVPNVKKAKEAAKKQQCIKDAPGIAITKEKTAFEPQNFVKLKPIVDQITLLKDYENSPTCMYVMTAYYIGAKDGEKAQVSYNKLKTALKNGGRYGSNLKDYLGPNDLELFIKATKAQQSEYKSNTLLTPLDAN